jgi:hypothetical protein
MIENVWANELRLGAFGEELLVTGYETFYLDLEISFSKRM